MGVEIFLYAFKDGEAALFPIAQIERVFNGFITRRDETEDSLVLSVEYPTAEISAVPGIEVIDGSDLFITRDQNDPQMTSGFMVSMPATHPAFHNALLAILRHTPSALFWEDALVVGNAATLQGLPDDMVDRLGPPVIVATGADILARLRQ